MSPTRVFGRLSLFFVIGGVAAALAMQSWWPLVVVGLVVWSLLRFTNGLERRRP